MSPGRRGTTSKNFDVKIDENKLDQIFASVDQCHLPGAAVGIAIEGRPVYRKGFGLANMELPVVLSPTIRMRIASTSKHFACLAYMLLCQEDRARLDDPIKKYLPELHPNACHVTLRQLMGHVSGLRDAKDICLQFSGTGRGLSTAELFSFYRDIDDVNFAPGVSWNYNNGGYVMLTLAIERIAGQPLEDVLRERIFEPIAMYDTLLRRWDTDFVSNSATLHTTRADGSFAKSYLGIASASEGGVVSTVDDMLRWLAHMEHPVVGTAATWQTLREPLRLANGTSTGYGLGLMVDRYRGLHTLFHPGGVMGGNSQMLKVPMLGLDVVVMVNRDDVSSVLLARKILDACVPGLDPARNRVSGPCASGNFRSLTTGRVIQLFAKEGEQMASIDGVEMLLERDESGVLWPGAGFEHLKQGITLEGSVEKPSAIHFSDFGNPDDLIRVLAVDKPGTDRIEGRYQSAATGTEATIYEASGGVQLATVGRFGSAQFNLECLGEGIWRAKATNSLPLGGILLFDRDRAGFRFSSTRTSALPFKRCR